MSSMPHRSPAMAPAGFRATRTLLFGFVAAMIAFGLAGAQLAADAFRGGHATHEQLPATPKKTFGVGDAVPTSFGAVAVQHSQRAPGVTRKAVASAAHGVPDFIGPHKARVQATVTLTNLGDGTTDYSPKQFSLLVGEKKTVRLHSSTLRPGELQPDAAIDGKLAFVVPRDGKRLRLRFDDPRRGPMLIDLGRTGTYKGPAPGDHGHRKGAR
jgi:Domain of unknown function (DUF4352)